MRSSSRGLGLRARARAHDVQHAAVVAHRQELLARLLPGFSPPGSRTASAPPRRCLRARSARPRASGPAGPTRPRRRPPWRRTPRTGAWARRRTTRSASGAAGDENTGAATPSRQSLNELAPTLITRSGKNGDLEMDRTAWLCPATHSFVCSGADAPSSSAGTTKSHCATSPSAEEGEEARPRFPGASRRAPADGPAGEKVKLHRLQRAALLASAERDPVRGRENKLAPLRVLLHVHVPEQHFAVRGGGGEKTRTRPRAGSAEPARRAAWDGDVRAEPTHVRHRAHVRVRRLGDKFREERVVVRSLSRASSRTGPRSTRGRRRGRRRPAAGRFC